MAAVWEQLRSGVRAALPADVAEYDTEVIMAAVATSLLLCLGEARWRGLQI